MIDANKKYIYIKKNNKKNRKQSSGEFQEADALIFE